MAPSNGHRRPGLRDTLDDTLVQLGHERPDIVVLDADLYSSIKTARFKQTFPDRFLQVGIAEANMFGIAAGLAEEGFIPFPATFAAFASRRALDQIAISITYPGLNVKIPGVYVGPPTGKAGASHNAIEDLAIFRSLPNMKVADPGDNADLRAIIRTAVETPGPVYFRITRLAVPDLFGPEHTFAWGTGETLREGSDVTIAGTGVMTWLALQAADLLRESGVSAEVLHLASIKPLDAGLVRQSTRKTRCLVTAENASIIGGLGAAVAEAIEDDPVPMRRVGVRDRWSDSGLIDDLFTEYQMKPKDIADAALAVMELRKTRSR